MEYFEREMSDRELLEVAAKAAELKVFWGHPSSCSYDWQKLYFDHGVFDRRCPEWNPLTDAAAAMHLAVKLEMLVDTMDGRVIAGGTNSPEVVIDFKIDEDDPYAATRRAIVMAAAVVGKGMK